MGTEINKEDAKVQDRSELTGEEKNKLFEEVFENIQREVYEDEYSGIARMLKYVPTSELKYYAINHAL